MADTTALKNRIRAAIKANGNQEITGPVLQQALLDMVDELDLNPELENEVQQRQNGDTQLNNLITGIKNNIDNGYVYAGIATPSTVPVSGKVFYIATAAGTYTNFSGQVLTKGINILSNNGSAWNHQQLIGIDDEPTAGSDNLVKSGGVEKFTSHGWKQGYIRNDGEIADNSGNSIYNTYYFPIVKDRKYNLSSQTGLLWSISLYDTDKAFIRSVNWFTNISNYIATQDGFIRISLRKLDSSTFNSNEWIDFNPMVTESIPSTNQLTIGARYATTFDTISNSTNRLTVKEILKMPVGSRIQCTLASGYSLNLLQKESAESDNYVDSGWIDKRIIEFNIVYPYQSINIRKNDDSDFSDRSIVDMFHIDILNDSILGTVHSVPEKVHTNRLFTEKHIVVRHQVNSAEMTYQAALEGYKFIESDVRMSSDGVFVLCHNNTVKYNGEDVNVENLTWEQLKSVGVGNFIDQLNICSQFGLYLFAEWKPITFTNSVIDDFVGLLVKYLGYNNFTLNKFYGEGQAYYDYIRRKDKNITFCYTTFRGTLRPDLIKVIKNDVNAVLSFDFGATFDKDDKYGLGAYYEQAKELGITIGFWTPPTIDCMRAMTFPDTGFIVTNSYILDNAQIIDKQYRSNYVFAQDELLTHNGIVENGKLHLSDGQSVTIPIQQTTGALVVDFMIDGDFEVTTVDNGEGQDITEYPTGILHPDGNHFESGTYRYGIELRKNRTGNFVITADGDAYISVINITQSCC